MGDVTGGGRILSSCNSSNASSPSAAALSAAAAVAAGAITFILYCHQNVNIFKQVS